MSSLLASDAPVDGPSPPAAHRLRRIVTANVVAFLTVIAATAAPVGSGTT